eukprot:19247-Pyramimonas_sp.AAC.1
MTRLARGFKAFAFTATSTTTLRLLIPHDVYPGCTSPAEVLDIWGHEFMEDQWKLRLSRVEFFRQSVRCVFPGQFGPLHHIKSIA